MARTIAGANSEKTAGGASSYIRGDKCAHEHKMSDSFGLSFRPTAFCCAFQVWSNILSMSAFTSAAGLRLQKFRWELQACGGAQHLGSFS